MNIPHEHWNKFYTNFAKTWKQSEHVAIVGSTGSGKTTLLRKLLPLRTYTAIMATKPYDSVMTDIERDGYVKFETWPVDLSAHAFPKRIIWPDATVMGALKTYQQPVFELMIEHIYTVGGWTVVVDELYFLTNFLKMREPIKMYLTQGRSMHLTLVMCAQRTSSVPVETFNQSTHMFFFQENDDRNLSVIGRIAYRLRNHIKDAINELEAHEFLYFNKLTAKCVISKIT